MERSVTTTGEIERVVRISATSVVLDGRALAVVTLEDRTADRELAETLEEVERHLDTVTTNLPALLFTIESDGVVSHIEGSGLARLGQEPGDLVGVNLFERFGDERTVTGSVRRAMRGESVEAVVELGGTPFQAWFRPVYDDGTVDRVVGMALDVTDQRRRQQLLEVFNRVLRHNLRNELNVVLGAARNARSRGAAPEVETCLDQVVGAAERLLRTGEKAHPLAAIERETDDPAVRDLRRVVMAACRTVAERFPDAELETDLPDHPVRVRARGIERAVTELLDNAVRHNDATGPRAAVTVALGGSERGAELSVVDDGPGLSSMEQSVLSRGRETPLHHSEGLGLWLVSWVLMSAGGEFSVDSSDGGTTVTVELPALDDN
jgi:signal transduction histidine kinase